MLFLFCAKLEIERRQGMFLSVSKYVKIVATRSSNLPSNESVHINRLSENESKIGLGQYFEKFAYSN